MISSSGAAAEQKAKLSWTNKSGLLQPRRSSRLASIAQSSQQEKKLHRRKQTAPYQRTNKEARDARRRGKVKGQTEDDTMNDQTDAESNNVTDSSSEPAVNTGEATLFLKLWKI